MKYLITYRVEGEFVAEMKSMSDVAKEIGFADCSGAHDFRVYRILPNKDPERLEYEHDGNYVYLWDRFGNEIEAAEYPEH